MGDIGRRRFDLRLRAAWTPEREAQALRRLTAARARRLSPRAYALAGAVAAAAVVTIFALARARSPWLTSKGPVTAEALRRPANDGVAQAVPTPPMPVADATGIPGTMVAAEGLDRRVRFPDGSSVLLVGTDTVLKLISLEDRRIESELLAGFARFEVAKRRGRLFRVRAGEATIEVLGTSFVLERRGAGVHVHVIEGRVRVAWTGGELHLLGGEAGTFPPRGTSGGATARMPDAAVIERSCGSTAVPCRRSSPGAGAQPKGDVRNTRRVPRDGGPANPTAANGEGIPDQARRAGTAEVEPASSPPAVSASPRSGSTDHLAAMLKAADEARAGGRSIDAAAALRAAAAHSGADPRVPLAEFRLGRLLLEDLGQPREAAAAFARARALAPAGPLASDALAREVQARAAGGERASARALAREYLSRYPAGTHTVWVRRWGAIE
jgi:transmembrane sensor